MTVSLTITKVGKAVRNYTSDRTEMINWPILICIIYCIQDACNLYYYSYMPHIVIALDLASDVCEMIGKNDENYCCLLVVNKYNSIEIPSLLIFLLADDKSIHLS